VPVVPARPEEWTVIVSYFSGEINAQNRFPAGSGRPAIRRAHLTARGFRGTIIGEGSFPDKKRPVPLKKETFSKKK
jgi:hypothetical protein